MDKFRNSRYYLQYLTRTGVLVAIALVLMQLEFPIPPFPGYLKFGFSDVAALVGGVVMGPIAAIVIQVMKNILSLILGMSQTGGIGEMANAVAGIGLVVPVVMIYNRIKSNKGLLIGLIAGALVMNIVANATNYFVMFNLYFDAPSPEFKWNLIKTTFIWFNLLKAFIEGVVSFGLIRYLSPLMNVLKIEE